MRNCNVSPPIHGFIPLFLDWYSRNPSDSEFLVHGPTLANSAFYGTHLCLRSSVSPVLLLPKLRNWWPIVFLYMYDMQAIIQLYLLLPGFSYMLCGVIQFLSFCVQVMGLTWQLNKSVWCFDCSCHFLRGKAYISWLWYINLRKRWSLNGRTNWELS